VAAYSTFFFEIKTHSLENLLAEVRAMGYDVSRTKAVAGPAYPDGRERGYQVDGTDITIEDPVQLPGYGSGGPVVQVFCPSKTKYIYGDADATHDPEINRKVYNRLKRKFARKEK